MYKVVKRFRDLQDNGYVYNISDIYPRKGLKVKKARIEELASNKNKRKTPLIIEVVKNGKPDRALQGTKELV